MRIIRGKFSGKTIPSPVSELTRPTSDRVRQAIFNIVEHSTNLPPLLGATVLDVFAGTGAMGLEALSRGANHAIFVDVQRPAILNLQNTLHDWKLKDRATVILSDALKLPTSNTAVDLIFCDPPYGKDLVNQALNHLYTTGWISPDTAIITELHKRDPLSPAFPTDIICEKRYGDTKIYILKLKSDS